MDPFTKYNALLYALIGAQDDSYMTQARYLCAMVDALIPANEAFRKRVIDVGCGYGVSTLAAFEHFGIDAGSILATDSSPDMCRMLRGLYGGNPFYVNDLLADPALSQVLDEGAIDQLRWYLYRMQNRFLPLIQRREAAKRHVSELVTFTSDIATSPSKMGVCNIVLANNVFHWPVQALMKDGMTADEALAKVFTNCSLDRRYSEPLTIGFLVPIDFVDAGFELTEHNALLKHPDFLAMQTLVNGYLYQNHGIKRDMPCANPLFSDNVVLNAARRAFPQNELSITVRNRTRVDFPHTSMVEALWCRLPMQLSKITALSVEEKIALMRHIREAMVQRQGSEVRPLCNTDFVYVISVR